MKARAQETILIIDESKDHIPLAERTGSREKYLMEGNTLFVWAPIFLNFSQGADREGEHGIETKK